MWTKHQTSHATKPREAEPRGSRDRRAAADDGHVSLVAEVEGAPLSRTARAGRSSPRGGPAGSRPGQRPGGASVCEEGARGRRSRRPPDVRGSSGRAGPGPGPLGRAGRRETARGARPRRRPPRARFPLQPLPADPANPRRSRRPPRPVRTSTPLLFESRLGASRTILGRVRRGRADPPRRARSALRAGRSRGSPRRAPPGRSRRSRPRARRRSAPRRRRRTSGAAFASRGPARARRARTRGGSAAGSRARPRGSSSPAHGSHSSWPK